MTTYSLATMTTTTREVRTAPTGTPHHHREDIQGLRAVAVLTVIAAHAGLGLPGGFVGVDVFFVVSGYLISSLLYREVGRTGRVSITSFYARRARRILPAATVVSVVTLAASVLLLSLIEALQVLRDAVWSALFVANHYFAFQETDYFAQDAGPSVLQHFWSLAVEEQFYLAWPVLLLGFTWWARRRGGPPLPIGPLTALLAGVIAVSLAYSVWFTATNQPAAYFSTGARVWELGIGALGALLAPRVGRHLGAAVRSVLVVGGLGAVLIACLAYSPTTLFPGYTALLPVLGTVAVLVAGDGLAGATPLPIRVLGSAPLRTIGDWSYSLYLWHWPLLVVPERHLGRDLRPTETVVALVLTFVLSWASYRWVETPFRRARGVSVRRTLLLYPLSLALVATSCLSGWAVVQARVGGFTNHPAITLDEFGVPDEPAYTLDANPQLALVQASVIAARHDMAIPSDLKPDLLSLREDNPPLGECDYSKGSRNLCPLGDPDADRTVVVLGDSHGRMWIPALDEFGAEHGWRAYFLVKPHCTAAYLVTDENGSERPFEECTQFHDWVEEQMADLDPELTVVSTGLFSRTVFHDGQTLTSQREIADLARTRGFPDLYRAVRPLTDRLVLLRDVPSRSQDPGECLTTTGADLGSCASTPTQRAELMARASVDAAEALGVEVVDPRRWVCWDGLCPAVVGDHITYRDTGHITATYARWLADPLGRALGLDR